MVEKKPNILFIMADQMKSSILKMYSEIGIECPQLEKLASEGVLYKNAFTPHPLCVPARTSMMTGKYPHKTGCRRNETLMPENELHAFKIWKKLNYVTGLIGKNHCFDKQSDLDLFDVRLEISHRGLPRGGYKGENVGNKGMEWIVDEKLINEANNNRLEMGIWEKTHSSSDAPEELFPTSLITKQTEKFLEKYSAGEFGNTHNPFSLWVSFPDPHEPYIAPARYVNMFPPEKVVLPNTREYEFTDGTAPERNRLLYKILGHNKESEDDIRSQISVYQAMTKFIDDGIKKIVEKLDTLGLKENTIIVFTSDHGDFMGEHGMTVKGGVFYDCLVKVPLIISWPNGKFNTGVIDESMVNTIDILPTLLFLQGLGDFKNLGKGWANNKQKKNKFLNEYEMRSFDGKLLPTITDSKPSEVAFSEYGAGGPQYKLEDLNKINKPYGHRALLETLWAREAEGKRRMVRTKDWKYITDISAKDHTINSAIDGGPGDIDELYDLKNDPWELYNIAQDPKYKEIIVQMKEHLLEWMIDTEDYNPLEIPNKIGINF